tara:strand:- start:251 stop:679 length:429 start_codon:yes stop_codon:yes gene_type:complete
MNIFEKINKFIPHASVIFNAALLMIIFGVVPVLLYSSVILNFVFLWFITRNLQKNIEIDNTTEKIIDKINLFRDHLEQIYELEMYYGDENLKSLIDHSRQLINDFVDFEEDHYDQEAEFEPAENDDEEAGPPQEEQLFYKSA